MKKQQLDYLNNLKTFLVLLVVLQHSAGAYTTGENWLIINPDRVTTLKTMLSVNSSFFMGLFFLVSAFFVPASIQRYRQKEFVTNKIKRLLIPTLIGVVLVLPLTYYGITYPENFFKFYLDYFQAGTANFGHTWFLVQLFVYATVFATLSLFMPSLALKQNNKPLTFTQAIGYIIVLTAVTFLVALISPINQWYWHHLVEPYHLPQYISLFSLGIIAYRRDWLTLATKQFGFIWLFIAAIAIAYKLILTTYGLNQDLLQNTIWTSVQCVSTCIGLLILFREYSNYSNQFLKFLSDNAFAVYIFHVPIVVWLQRGLLNLTMSPINKFLITSIIAYFAAYGLSSVLRRSKLISSII